MDTMSYNVLLENSLNKEYDYIIIYVQILQNIEDFLNFLIQWEKEAKRMQYSFMTEQTCYGLKISLKATLEICSFLIYKCRFEYLMTSRLNQDNLEVDISFSKYVNKICHM